MTPPPPPSGSAGRRGRAPRLAVASTACYTRAHPQRESVEADRSSLSGLCHSVSLLGVMIHPLVLYTVGPAALDTVFNFLLSRTRSRRAMWGTVPPRSGAISFAFPPIRQAGRAIINWACTIHPSVRWDGCTGGSFAADADGNHHSQSTCCRAYGCGGSLLSPRASPTNVLFGSSRKPGDIS
jgi:hypothetical protein